MDMYGVQEGPCMSTILLRGCLIQKKIHRFWLKGPKKICSAYFVQSPYTFVGLGHICVGGFNIPHISEFSRIRGSSTGQTIRCSLMITFILMWHIKVNVIVVGLVEITKYLKFNVYV